MLKNVNWSSDRSYRSGSENEPIEFFMAGLCNSTSFDLLLGYFSSAAINVLSLGFATFLYNGGKLRIVVNNVLSQQDKDAIKLGMSGSGMINLLDLSDIENLKKSLDDYGKHFFECLAFLISQNRIEIKIVKPKSGRGIAHYKSGAFYDGNETVGFKASCNFTAFGLIENLEELDAFLSWENSRSTKMIKRQNSDFENLFSGNSEFVEYVDINDVTVAIRNEFGNSTMDELIIKEKELNNRKNIALNNDNLKEIIKVVNKQIDSILWEPKFPFEAGPRPYQIEAYNNWVNNDYKGIFAMATGTGKTITSLNCLLNEYKSCGYYRGIILVPTTSLLEQWKQECRKFNFRNIISISSNENWNNELAFFNTSTKFSNNSYIVIVTYASFIRPKFQSHFEQLDSNVILIADEAHNIGAPKVLEILSKVHLNKRIGLSATPNRKFDEKGNDAIESFFNDKPPYVYSYSMEQALKTGSLCSYLYYPHIVYLNEVELKEYIRLSKQLLIYFDAQLNTFKDCKEVETLLLARKRIIHKASNKLKEFNKIITSEFEKRGNLKYSLIYVPEGIEPDYSQTDNQAESEEDISLIDEYTRAVSSLSDDIMVKQFTSLSSNREEILNNFEKGTIHALTSMKCLDEGVDVPRSELAIFCSSTGNPRQFIQRRGRVLRLHKEKTHAVIHDLVVIPRANSEDSSFELEKSLVKKELERVVDFSSLSMNKMDTYRTLKDILEYYNLNLNDF